MTSAKTRVLVLGGGFAGIYTALHLERRGKGAVEVTLINRDNYFLMTPLLFEAGSGILEPRHAVNPIRPLFRTTRFIEAEVLGVDLDRKVVTARHAPAPDTYELEYDHLVLALGGVTNRAIIPGSERALTFKTLADAIFVRNRIIDLFEQADVETDADRKRSLLSFAVVGAGLVGVELIGEMTEFVRALARPYPRVNVDDVRFYLIEAGPKVLPEMDRDLADHATRSLEKRGVVVRTSTPVRAVEANRLVLANDESIEAHTIVLATGVAPNPLLATIPVEKGKGGRVVVDAQMRVKDRPGVWAIGDCAHIPDPQGNPYPPLAQHALREAKVLAGNILASIAGGEMKAFEYRSMGTLAALGHFDGVGRVMKLKLKGFPAWWVWRTYYLFQMPRFERRLRIMLDWTVALFFKNDVVKLDLFGDQHPLQRPSATPAETK